MEDLHQPYLSANVLPQERDLIARISQGDAAAMKTIFDAYFVRLRYYAISVTGEKEEVQDIVQESFLQFWISLKDKRVVPDNLETYLFGILRHRCLMHLRKEQRHQRQEGEAFERWQRETEDALKDAELREKLYHLLSQHFTQLTDVQSQVMKLLYLDQLSVQEAAVQLGTSENNIRNHKARAIERLRQVAEGEILLLLLFFEKISGGL